MSSFYSSFIYLFRSYTEDENAKKENNLITYGDFTDIKPFKTENITIH